ncbi:hypothetical protein ACFQPF_01695 [Fictibacillus iocasae]|uniref:Holin n=1 Tax=Fictibacillus iocasae TaxID=2715437 RepID=A0ABW2NLB5_9BACL
MVSFAAYAVLSALIAAIRETERIPNKYIPLTAILLGVLYAWFDEKLLTSETLLHGVQYALYATGSVAGYKYFTQKPMPPVK